MASSVSFPTSSHDANSSGGSELTTPTRVAPRPPFQPFRRMSLPTAPSPALRPISIASLQEEPGLDPLPPNPRKLNNNQDGKLSSPKSDSLELPMLKGKKPNRSVVSFHTNAPMDEQKLAKRNKIIDEFYDSEKTYVDGLNLIYETFLTPILNSLNTQTPLLTRTQMTTMFVNFIDIWNLHRSFLASLEDLLHNSRPSSDRPPTASSPNPTPKYHPPLSPPLIAHFPYLSLYNPFVTAFSAVLETLLSLTTPSSPQYSPTFASFVATQEKDLRFKSLRLRDFFLTIVQRCPRYLLLLKDLESVESDDTERRKLLHVLALVDKITSALNDALQANITTVALIGIQRNTSGLPIQLIAPGRTLIKRGPLFQVERSEPAKEREFLLFSDCLIWLATEEGERDWGARHWWQSHNQDKKRHSALNPRVDKSKERSGPVRPAMPPRTRSKSEAEIEDMKAQTAHGCGKEEQSTSLHASPDIVQSPISASSIAGASSQLFSASTSTSPTSTSQVPPSSPSRPPLRILKRESSSPIPRLSPRKKSSSRQSSVVGGAGGSGGDEQKWVFKGRLQFVDMDVVVLRPVSYHSDLVLGDDEEVNQDVFFEDDEDEGDDARRFEVHSPMGSFVLYASSSKERDDWVEAIRTTKESFLASLNAATRVGSSRIAGGLSAGVGSTGAPGVGTWRGVHGGKRMVALPYKPGDERIETLSRKSLPKPEGKNKDPVRRSKVDHFVPPIWIPDSKTGECMRCGRSFGWRRRRHHCRLCGRCVCGGCSERTFYISNGKEKEKANRACNACYETVFPVVISSPEGSTDDLVDLSQQGRDGAQSTIGSLTNFPSWLSMPSLPLVAGDGGGNAAALMAIDSTHFHPLDDANGDSDGEDDIHISGGGQQLRHLDSLLNSPSANFMVEDGRKVVKVREPSGGRPKSFVQLVEDFHADGGRPTSEVILNSDDEEAPIDPLASVGHDTHNAPLLSFQSSPSTSSAFPSPVPPRSRRSSRASIVLVKKKEDTMRKKKRFSLPAVAIHTTTVTAHSSAAPSQNTSPGAHGKHQSLHQHPVHGSHQHTGAGPSVQRREKRFSLVLGGITGASKSRVHTGLGMDGVGDPDSSLAGGVAAGRLNELLGRKKGAEGT